ncbi:MAG: helix-turn-helix transcriptional regulator [Paludibacter sp.]|nr:helix-turn-helix transcriptional regulator [Paludibacter sp.]
MKKQNTFHPINTVAEYHRLLQIEKPEHPLMSIIDFSKINYALPDSEMSIVLNLYCISIKQDPGCILHYGPNTYDFNEGVMTFFKPGQVIKVESTTGDSTEGYMLTFHPDFIQLFPLALQITKYAFFNYDFHEALFLSDKEKLHIREMMAGIKKEYQSNIDSFSQEAIVAYIELLLVYVKRYYSRQFITRKPQQDEVLLKFERLLDIYFSNDNALSNGLPSVQYFAERLNLSANYLSDLLRIATGQSAQSHIQNKVIDLTKTLLTTSNLSVSEIAYQLGFERPQSLNKLFRKKINLSPLEYRNSFN